MKFLRRLVLTALLFFVSLTMGILGWFFLYQGDLPDARLLAQFAPGAPGVASDPCLPRPIAVVPAREIGDAMRKATEAAEPERVRPFQLARFMLCERRSNLKYALDQYRLVCHIRFHFSKDQELTALLNRLYFAEDTFGVSEASRHFFGKKPGDLTIAEAALLAGMIRAPLALSPYNHPDRALVRRNQVIEAMKRHGAITATEASKAEEAPLGVSPQARQ